MADTQSKFVICRTYSAGVFAGFLESREAVGERQRREARGTFSELSKETAGGRMKHLTTIVAVTLIALVCQAFGVSRKENR